MKNYYYADGVENITFAEGMIRINLFHYGERQGQQCAREVTEQLVLPPAGFLRAFESARRLVEQMEQQGLITNAAKSDAAPAPHSPNFN